MAIPDGHSQMNLYLPDELLAAVNDAARAETGKMNARSDWVRDAIKTKLGQERDARLVSIESAFESMNERGRDALAEFAAMAAAYGPFRG